MEGASPATAGGPGPSWPDEHDFRRVEKLRREANYENGDLEKLFISHCWRDITTQERKRKIIDHLSKPVEEGGGALSYWADYLDLQAEGPVPWRAEIEEGIADCSKFVAFVDYTWLTSYNCLQAPPPRSRAFIGPDVHILASGAAG